MYLLIFEFLGTNEVLVILVVALILLGPRRLPEMSRKIGKSLAEFKRTSEEFKRTWEREVDLEGILDDGDNSRAMLSPSNSILSPTIERGSVANLPTEPDQIDDQPLEESIPAPSVTPIEPTSIQSGSETTSDQPVLTTPTRKRDWL